MAKGSRRILKHQVLNNVDYGYITRYGKTILEIEGKDLEGLEWRQFQKLVGSKIGAGRIGFTIKFKGDPEVYAGITKAVDLENKVPAPEDPGDKKIVQLFTDLKKDLERGISSGGVTFDMLLNATKSGYDTQINFLNQQLVFKDGVIKDLREDLRDSEEDLDDCSKTVKELEGKTGIGQYIGIAQKLLENKFGSRTPVPLESSDTSDIPQEILTVLGYCRLQTNLSGGSTKNYFRT